MPFPLSLAFRGLGSRFCRRFGYMDARKSVVRSPQKRSPINGSRPGRERRKWTRLPLAIPVFVRSRDGKSNELLEFATALNVSAGGMLIAVRKTPALATELHLEIPSAPVSALALLPKSSRGLRARVLRSTHMEGYNLLGLKFFHPLLQASKRRKARKRKAVSVA